MADNQKLPVQQLVIICVCRLAEPICFTVIFPFIVFMVRDFHIGKESDVGFYVGIITSSFALAQLIFGIPWGMVSDRIGRRPVILIGMLGTIVTILSLGLSKTYVVALLSRTFCGVLNGNTGVYKSMVSEITIHHSPSQRAFAFGLIPLMSGLGGIIGSMLGGILSNPVQKFPNVFGRGGFLTNFLLEYPYFLPCFVSGLTGIAGFVFSFLFLEETMGRENVAPSEERSRILDERPRAYDSLTCDHASQGANPHVPSTSTASPHTHKRPSLRDALVPAVLSSCLTYGLFSFQSIYYDELFPLWASSSRDNGGLGYRSDQIGYTLAFSGLVTLVSQFFLMPRLIATFGLVRSVRLILFHLIMLYFLQGFTAYLYDIPSWRDFLPSSFWVWVGLLVITAFKTFCTTISVSSLTLLTNNAAPRQDVLGTVNGFSQCCANGMRGLGPTVCGVVWSLSQNTEWLPHRVRAQVSWIFLSFIAVVTFCSSMRLHPEDYEMHFKRSQDSEVETT